MRSRSPTELPPEKMTRSSFAHASSALVRSSRRSADVGCGYTVDIGRPSYQAQGSDADLESLLGELQRGEVRGLFIHGVNPAYDLPGEVASALKKVPLVVSFAERLDETAALAHYVCPDRDYLESWGDAEPAAGFITVTQPVIRPLGETRPLLESLAAWSGRPQPVYDILRDSWQARLYPRRLRDASFEQFWDTAVHDGCVQIAAGKVPAEEFNSAAVQSSALPAARTEFEIVLYPTVAMHDGRNAYNPWLHELPDPINKVAWDNCASLSPAAAQKLGVKEGDVVRVQLDGNAAVELPAYIQPGQHEDHRSNHNDGRTFADRPEHRHPDGSIQKEQENADHRCAQTRTNYESNPVP